jgi:FMN phosphatase YigB (HAD superfamily)
MAAHASRPDLVVFDLGGVLVRIAQSWAEGCRLAGVEVRGEAGEPATWAQREPLVVAYEVGRIDRAQYCSELARVSGGLYTAEEVGRIHDAWLIEEFAGLGAVFDALDRAGVASAVLSNTNAAHWDVQFPTNGATPKFPTLARVTHPHASHLLGARKPDREIFRALEEATGRPGRVLFFDDLGRNVEGARAAGWEAVLIDPLADPPAQVRAALATRFGIPDVGTLAPHAPDAPRAPHAPRAPRTARG